MAIIQKRADELTPGDILPANAAYGRRVVVAIEPSALAGGLFVKSYGCEHGALDADTVPIDRQFDVEVPDLTPAQLHAEELLAMVRRIAASEGGARRACEEARELVDLIEPPEAPTLAEALAALQNLTPILDNQANTPHDRRAGAALALLERARRAGVL